MKPTRRPYLADAALVLTCFLWGLNTVVTKNALGDAPDSFRAFVFNGLRIPAASLLLFAAAKVSGRTVMMRRRDFPLMAGVSFFGMFLFIMTFILGLSLTSAANAGVINASTPLFILLVSLLSGIERPSARTTAGIIVGFSGMVALTWGDGGAIFNPGDLLILLSCLFWAVYTVFGKRVLDTYNPVVAIAWIYLLTSIFQLPFFAAQLPGQSWTKVSPENWLNLGISCVGSLFLANSLYYYSIARIGPSLAGVYTNLTPVFTLFLAAFMRGEHITHLQVGGLLVIISGIAVANWRRTGAGTGEKLISTGPPSETPAV
jgi:drug/metabolite transporter (DMT)-like permease